MKVLFLDIDGVVNSRNTTDFRNNLYPVDPYMAFLVGKIHMYTGCDVVVSSAWRYDPRGMDAVRKIVPVFDITPKTNATRGEQIRAWLKEHPEVKKYAILDDDSDMLPEQLPNFFKTTFENGLTDEIAERVMKHLNEE